MICARSSALCCSIPASRKALAKVISFVVIVDYRPLRPFCCSLQFGKALFELLDPALNLANAPVEFVKLTCNLVIGHVLLNRKISYPSRSGIFRHPKPRAIGLFCQFLPANGPAGLSDRPDTGLRLAASNFSNSRPTPGMREWRLAEPRVSPLRPLEIYPPFFAGIFHPPIVAVPGWKRAFVVCHRT
jgi:hypothetical protein